MANRRALKIICMLLLLINILSVPVNASAQGDTYEIPEMSMTFEIPSYLSVISKGIKQNDVLFTSGNFDYIQTMSVIRDNDDYYLIYDKDKTFTLEVRISDTLFGFDNMTKASEKKLQSTVDSLKTKSGVIGAEVYDSGEYKFIDLSETSNNGSNTVFKETFLTTYNKQDLSITISSINDKPTDTERNLIKGMADSVVFPKESELDLSALSPTLVIAFLLLMAGFAAVVVIRLKNIPIPILSLEDNGGKGKAKERNDKQTNVQTIRDNSDTEEKDESQNSEDETEESLSEEELAQAIANFE